MSKEFFSKDNDSVDALFYSRPLVLPGSAFGAINFFFDPSELKVAEVEELGKKIADLIDNYCIEKEKRQRMTN